jgi:hypothetical protein
MKWIWIGAISSIFTHGLYANKVQGGRRNLRILESSWRSPYIYISRNILDDIIAIVAQGLEGILAMFEGNAEEALTFVQNMLDMLLELVRFCLGRKFLILVVNNIYIRNWAI